MPVSRGYGGYTPSYSPSYFSLYSPSALGSSYSYKTGRNTDAPNSRAASSQISGAVTGRSSATGTGTTGTGTGYSTGTSGYSTATGSRAGTPSRGSSFEPTSVSNPSTTASILAEADRRRELRNYVFNPVGKVNLKPNFCC